LFVGKQTPEFLRKLFYDPRSKAELSWKIDNAEKVAKSFYLQALEPRENSSIFDLQMPKTVWSGFLESRTDGEKFQQICQ